MTNKKAGAFMFYDKISSPMDMDFSDWLLHEMSERGWSQSDLARASGLHRQSISDYVNKRRTKPETEPLIAIANAFKIAPVTVLRKAGLLPMNTNEEIKFDDWKYLLNQLTPAEQEEMRQIIELKIDLRQKNEKAQRAKNFKQGKVKK